MSTVVAKHSRLGASSAERWMACPGSNVIIEQLGLEKDTDESSFAAEGTAAHEAASFCLVNQIDAWEIVGKKFYDHEVTVEMTDAIQLYLDVIAAIRNEHTALDPYGASIKRVSLVEERVSGSFDDLFFGTVDSAEYSPALLDITDYKHGVGIAVDAEENAQLMYYAVGILLKMKVQAGANIPVRLRIVQPRAFHADGPVRVWETTSTVLFEWLTQELRPAMERARFDTSLTPGEHCRFCPSKLACPVLSGLFKVAVTADASQASKLTNEQIALEYGQIAGVKHYIRALETDVLRRLTHGDKVSAGAPENTYKLVPKKANRVLKSDGVKAIEGGEAPFSFEEAYATKLKSVAELEKISSKAKKWVKEFAFTPQKELTVALSTDRRAAVKVSSPTEDFGDDVETTESIR